jgi:hypothetical protein
VTDIGGSSAVGGAGTFVHQSIGRPDKFPGNGKANVQPKVQAAPIGLHGVRPLATLGATPVRTPEPEARQQ